MKAVHRFLDLFRDSPTYGRDRANLFSGLSIGVTALLLNGAVLMLVLPLMLDPDDRDFLEITENVEFGQLLALILLGGATAFATLLIPLRLVTVFWGPRTGRYFDQIVLSGISPLRFMIGKATSQNLFLGLIGFLLLPYLILSLTLGGVDLEFFIAGLFLVWLYCMALALVTLWASLYLNEGLAALFVVAAAALISGLGCAPLPFQPFVLTPFPMLLHPVYTAIPFFDGRIPRDPLPIFLACAMSMTAVICIALFAIYLGPLYGIIRENSTFGEVVRAGDSKRKRWFRLRLHIQRPSEIAFFYENRSKTFRGNEGAIRLALAFGGVTLLSVTAYATFLFITQQILASGGTGPMRWWVYEFHASYLSIHGCSLALAIFVFSHARNTTYLRIPFLRGRKVEVARMDTVAFLVFLLLTSAASIATPIYFDTAHAIPAGSTIFPTLSNITQGREIDFHHASLEGTLAISVAALTIYAFHRLVCLATWLRTVSFAVVAILYLIGLCGLPLFFAAICLEIPELRTIELLQELAPVVAMISPFMVMMRVFNELGGRFPQDASTIPFYVVQGLLFVLVVLGIHRRAKPLREMYLTSPGQEASA